MELEKRKEKMYFQNTICLVLAGILINFVGSKFATLLNLPLFLDSIGTILVASLGGLLPGIIVGFFSNAINAIGDPISLYYGVLNILIAIVAYFCSKKLFFKNIGKAFLAVLMFSVIGGIVGSIFTWLLYNANFGQGISAPLSQYFYAHSNLPKFWSQLFADFLIDLLDKVVSVALVYVILHFLPSKFFGLFPEGMIYQIKDKVTLKERLIYRHEKRNL